MKAIQLFWGLLFIALPPFNYAQTPDGYDAKAKTEYSTNDVKAFIYRWFSGFDHQNNVDFFLQHIAEPVDMQFPGLPIRSKDDFIRWYQKVEDKIAWNSHAIQNLQVWGNEPEGWQASYDVHWMARDKNAGNIDLLIHQDVHLKRQGDILQITKHRAYARSGQHQDSHLTALMKAAGSGNVQEVRALLKSGASVFSLDPITGTSAVHFAAQGGSVEVMKALVGAGAESIINLQAASNSFTPLMVATWYQNPEMIRYLLSLKHINPLIKDNFGRTAADFPVVAKGYSELHDSDKEIATIYKDYFTEREQFIKETFEPDCITPKNIQEDVNIRIPCGNKGNDYHSPVLVAARDNNIGLFDTLVKNGAALTEKGEYMKAVVAHKAAYKGNAEIMKRIVAHPDFDAIKNAQGPTNGYTPLHDAIWHGHTECAKILLDAGVDTSLKAWDGMTPLDLAKKLDYQDIIALF